MPAARAPRRLPHGARRNQLILAALPVIAAGGLTDFSLDEVAERAGVTRNLLYHYFPRGRLDLALAVVELAERMLAAGWDFDPARPVAERVRGNFRRVIDHAYEPSDAWRVFRRAGGADDPELRARHEEVLDAAITAMSRNQLDTTDPAPLVRLALRGYLAFAETVLDEGRRLGTPPGELETLLIRTLAGAIEAAGTR